MPPLYKSLGVYLPLITTNCAVLGVTLINIDNKYNFMESLANSTFVGVGFTLVLIIFAGVVQSLKQPISPKHQGNTININSCINSITSFMGFAGFTS